MDDNMNEMLIKLTEEASKKMQEHIIKDTVRGMKDMLDRNEMKCRIDTDFCKDREKAAGTGKNVCADCPDQLPCAVVKVTLNLAQAQAEIKMLKIQSIMRNE